MRTQSRTDDPVLIEIHLARIGELFDLIDPSPHGQRDLSAHTEYYIVETLCDLPREAPLCLRVHVDESRDATAEQAVLQDAVRTHFSAAAASSRRRLRELFRAGRISLAIGLGVPHRSGCRWRGRARLDRQPAARRVDRRGLRIGGWVAEWRPMEIFLHDWWPLRAEARRHARLAAMPVELRPGRATG